jgi:hypothetical protein
MDGELHLVNSCIQNEAGHKSNRMLEMIDLNEISYIRSKVAVGPIALAAAHVHTDVKVAESLLQFKHNFNQAVRKTV